MATNPDGLIAQLLSNTGFGQTAQQIAAANLGNQQAQQNLTAGAQAIDINKFKLNAAKQQQEQDAAYNADVAAWIAAGSPPSGLTQLSAKYPDHWQAFQLTFKSGNEAQKRSDLQFYGGVRNMLDAKKPDIAGLRMLLSQRREAYAKAGQDTSIIDHYIQAIDAGDTTALSGLKGLATASMAATDPDQFGAIYKTTQAGSEPFTLVPGARRFDAEGKLIAEAPFAPRPVTVGEGQTVVEYDPNAKGGDPASGTGVIGGMLAVTPFAESGNREFNADGTRVTSPKGARGVMQVMPKTANDPGYGIAKSNGTPADDARLGREYLAKMLEVYGNPAQAWAAYNAGPGAVDAAIKKGGSNWLQQLPKETQQYVTKNMVALNQQQAGGGPRVIAQGAPKQQYRMLTPEEKQTAGLDPNLQYQQSPNGQITPLGGQNKQVKQIPDAVVTKVQPQIDARDTLGSALSTFRPDYGGHWVLGDRANDLQAIAGTGPAGMREWWARIYSMDNTVRNQLFGSALTATEQAAWERTTVSPKMRPEAIQANLRQRKAILDKALARRENFLKKNGYDPDAVDALFAPLGGATASAPATPAPAATPQFRIVARRPAR